MQNVLERQESTVEYANMTVKFGVKIKPDKIVLRDVPKDSKVNVDIQLQNVSKNAKVIHIRGPETKVRKSFVFWLSMLFTHVIEVPIKC